MSHIVVVKIWMLFMIYVRACACVCVRATLLRSIQSDLLTTRRPGSAHRKCGSSSTILSLRLKSHEKTPLRRRWRVNPGSPWFTVSHAWPSELRNSNCRFVAEPHSTESTVTFSCLVTGVLDPDCEEDSEGLSATTSILGLGSSVESVGVCSES